MTLEEVLSKLDEAIKDKLIHHSVRSEYAKLCNTAEGREAFLKILKSVQQLHLKTTLRKARKASRCKEVAL